MARLLFPAGKIILVPRGILVPLGRADIARYAEAGTVSRVQCIIENLQGDDGQAALKLTSKGSQNPTLVVGPGGQPRDLHQGQSAVLRDGEAFSLISTRPDLAIRIQLLQGDVTPRGAAAAVTIASVGIAAGIASARNAAGAGFTASDATSEPKGTPSAAAGPQLADPVRDAAAVAPGAEAPGDAADGSYSSPSKVYTSDGEGGGGGGGGETSSDNGGDAASAGTPGASPPAATGSGGRGASQGRSRKGGGKGGKGGARGVGNGKPPARSAPPVLLMLAGLPGSGKSTFSRELLRTSPVAWVHVNQDAIRDGRPGTREQCLAAARAALEQGACCVVDRCHADAGQRDALRVVATERGLAAHCVALQLPLELCARRVAARTDHPGGVQGDSSKRVVFTMAGQMKKGNSWPPAASEGFASVMDCLNDADTSAAVRAWAVYGSSGADAGPPAAGGDRDGLAAAAAGVPTDVTHGSVGDAAARSVPAAPDDAAAVTLAIWRDHAAKRKPVPAGIKSFFKSTSAGVAAKEAPGGAGAAAAAKAGVSALPGGKDAGAGTAKVPGAPAGGRIAAASAALRPTAASQGGEAVRKAAAGVAAGEKAPAPDKASPGGTRRLRDEPPDGERSAKRQAVEEPKWGGGSRSGGAAAATSISVPRTSDIQGASQGADSSPSGRNAFAVLMASASRKGADGRSGGGSAASGGGGNAARRPSGAHTGDEPDARFKLSAPWAQALRNTALNPDPAQQEVLYKDDQVVMILDVYPKAKHHALVIARDPSLRSIADLRQEHLALLEHMRQVACRWVQDERSKDTAIVAFKLGFHAVPSMCQVHMHVVSQDFNSAALKNKKHWNSFTTQFFLPLDTVRHELESRGRLTLIDQNQQHQLEGQELRCHGCSKPIKTMPELKKHIVACDAVLRLPGL